MMKKFTFLLAVVLLVSSCSDDSNETNNTTGEQHSVDNIMYLHSSENSLSGIYKVFFNGSEDIRALNSSTTAFQEIRNADFVTYLKLYAINDTPLRIKLNDSSIEYEGELQEGKNYEVGLSTDSHGHAIVTGIIQVP